MIPIYVPNSNLPKIFGWFAEVPSESVTLGFVVFCLGKPSLRAMRHGEIHYKQWLELGFILYPILYVFYYLRNRGYGLSPEDAFFEVPFEREAYAYESRDAHAKLRHPYQWVDYL